MLNPTCKRCDYEFKADLPDWQDTATCDLCTDEILAYVVRRKGRKASNRLRAAKRLYARAVVPSAGEVLPCEVDFTPQEAPAYDAPTHIDPMYEAVAQGEREARARALARPGSLGFDG